jgi:hypothetical protein
VDQSATAPPGVHFRFTNAKCTYSLKEVTAGIDFGYEVVVDADVSLTHSTCAGSPKAGSLSLFENVTDGKGLASGCGGGLCAAVVTTFVLKAGTYPATYHWDGHAYSAPADACVQGPLFTAGAYDLDIAEHYLGDAGPRDIHGLLHLSITP